MLQLHRLCYKSSSSALPLFPFAFISPTLERWPCGVFSACIIFEVGGRCVCVCLEKGASSESPIKSDIYWFSVLFKAFWYISADVFFNVRANSRKQLIFYSSSLLIPYFTYFLPLLSLGINLCLTHLLLYIWPCNCKDCNCTKTHPLCPLLLAVFESKLVRWELFSGCFFKVTKVTSPIWNFLVHWMMKCKNPPPETHFVLLRSYA